MSRFRLAALVFLAFCLGAGRLLAQTPIPSFPGALGYGGTATGAWTLSGTNHVGGTVYYVTNLNASGAGSFANGVETSGNIVEFRVGGDIFLDGPVTVANNVSIEGQTAPGGIMIYGGELSCYGHSNIICRFLHSEDGTLDPNYPGSSSTDSSANAANLGNSTNCILDHCSFEFASYNNNDASGTGSTNNITWQYCIFADPILEQQFNLHIQATNVTIIDTLFANSGGRNPLAKTNMQYVNNIVYNYLFAITTGDSGAVCSWDIINNYFITGPSNTQPADTFYQIDSSQSAYAIGNIEDSSNNGTLTGSPANGVTGATALSTYYSSTTASLPTISATSAFYYVTSVAGPLPHDQVDSQVVSQVLSLGSAGRLFNGEDDTGLGNSGYGTITGGTPLPDSDNSGMPDDWRAAVGISMTNPAISGSTSSTGYTYLENYLAWDALPNGWVAKNTPGLPTSLSINLSQYAGGFVNGSTYTVSGVTNGTVTQSGTGGETVTFTPTLNTSGLGGFSWAVDNGVTTMSGTFGVLISQSGLPQSVVWKGDGVTNAWDTTSTNWTVQSTGSATTFAAGDPVVFDDTGSASPPVAINGTVSPGTMTFDNNANTYTLSGTGAIAGAGALIMQGNGLVVLNYTGATTYSGTTTVVSGTLEIGNALALQDSTVNPAGGTFSFSQSTATFGALAGSGNISIGTVALTLGNNNATNTYSGSMTGSGSLETINTAGVITLSNYNVTGNLTVGAGDAAAATNSLTISGGTFGSSASILAIQSSTQGTTFDMSGGTATFGTVNIATAANNTGSGMTISGGTATFTTTNLGSGSDTGGNLIISGVDTNVALGAYTDTRDSNGGLEIEGGTVTATTFAMIGSGNSHAVNTTISGGSLTIGNSSSTGAFEIASGGSLAEDLNVSGGSLTYLGTDGLLLNITAIPTAVSLTGGVTSLTGITLNNVKSATIASTLTVNDGATLYLGSVGLVENLPDSGLSTSFGTATVGAIANWSSVAPIHLTGVTTFQAGNALGFAYNITLAGALSGTGELIKTGAGLLTLSASSSYSGGTVVSSGTMVLTGTLDGGNVTVQNTGALDISGGALTAATTTISAGGDLIDDGALSTALTNNGTVYANTGGVVTVTGNITNNGTAIVTNGTTFEASGTFTNNGILDIMTGSPNLPPRFVNNGIVLTSSVVKVENVAFTSTGDLNIAIQTYTGHTYQLQSEASLNSTWTNVTNNVTTQTNGSGVMTFTLSNVVPGSQFYRVQVGP